LFDKKRNKKKPPIRILLGRIKSMAKHVRIKELWIGVVEVRPLYGNHQILGNRKGAFVNIITWASDKKEFKN
jgi:hypothetical protein